MQSKNMTLILILISFVIVIMAVGCSPALEQADKLDPEPSNQAQTESLNTDDLSNSSGTTPSMPNVDSSELILVTTDTNNLYIINNSSNEIYYEAFPQEMLAVIEWAPCDNPGKCQDRVVKPDSEVSTRLNNIANRETTTITVYWWNLEKIPNEERYEVVNLDSIDLSIDK